MRYFVFFIADGYGEIPDEDLRQHIMCLLPDAVIIADYGRSLLIELDSEKVVSALKNHANIAYKPESPESFEE